MSGPVPPPRAAATWGLFAVAGILAVVGAAPVVTLVLALGAVTTVLATVGTARVLPKGARRGRPKGTELRVGRPPGVVIPVQPRPGVATPTPRTEQPRLRSRPPTAAELPGLTDEDLCVAWRASYLQLKRVQRVGCTPEAVAELTLTRALYLNELERRHPEGFSAWLASEPRAPSDPIGYLRRRRP
jgi:hypothetical protein